MHWDQMTATPDHLRVSVARLRGGTVQQEILEAILEATAGPWVGMLDADARYTAELKLHLVGRYRLTAAVTSAGKLSLAQLTDLRKGKSKDKVLSTKAALRQGWDTDPMPKPPTWLAYIQERVRTASAVVDRRAVIEYHLLGADRRLAAMDDTIAGMRASLDERVLLRDELAAEIADLRAELDPVDVTGVASTADSADALPVAADEIGRDAFEDPTGENVVQGQGFEVDVADVAVAHGEGTEPRGEGSAVGAVVEVAQDIADEMAAADGAVTVHGQDRGTGAAGLADGAVRVAAVGEERIESGPVGGLGIGVDVAFGGIDPEVDVAGEIGAQPPGVRQMAGEADNADAETDSGRGQIPGLGEEAVVGGLPRMVGAPEGEGLGIGFGEPAGTATEIGLDGDAPDMRFVG